MGVHVNQTTAHQLIPIVSRRTAAVADHRIRQVHPQLDIWRGLQDWEDLIAATRSGIARFFQEPHCEGLNGEMSSEYVECVFS